MIQLDIETIRNLCIKGNMRWTNHIVARLLQRNISTDNVVYTLLNGEIIEIYEDDHPYPSCLVLGITNENKHLHVVCSCTDTELWLITAYYPDTKDWYDDFKTRKDDNNGMSDV